MFTGLVQDIGRIEGVRLAEQAAELRIRTRLAADLRDGDSLAVNGVCLTVTEIGSDLLAATAVAETLARSTLGKSSPGQRVHLEPALRVGDPLGGHIVQGHVDGVGHLAQIERRGVSLEITVAAPPPLMRYLVEKGSVAIDGVSLTVARLQPVGPTVALVPHTLESTTFAERRAGEQVNIEVDILAKYVERLLGAWRPGGTEESKASKVDIDWLKKHGFA